MPLTYPNKRLISNQDTCQFDFRYILRIYEPEEDKSKSLEIKYCKIVCVLDIMHTVKTSFLTIIIYSLF